MILLSDFVMLSGILITYAWGYALWACRSGVVMSSSWTLCTERAAEAITQQREFLNAAPLNPLTSPSRQMLVWLQSPHTLCSILSLQTEAHSPLWLELTRAPHTHTLCVGQSMGLSLPKTFTHSQKVAPTSCYKGNSRGNLTVGVALLNLYMESPEDVH